LDLGKDTEQEWHTE